jgi:hypothetical protein
MGSTEGAEEAEAPPRAQSRRLLAVLLVAVNLPIVVATARALAHGWLPLGDNGILLARARDVGTSNHPLLGSWTSASVVVGENLNNPGPLYFDLLAPWVRILGPWVGVAVGVMLINMGAASLAVVAARRIAGATSMVAVAVVVVGLQFAMGSELLFDVWQPNALVLPFLAFLVLVTVLASGDPTMAPWVFGLGSLLVQTHMSHAVLVGALTVVAVGACVWHVRRSGEADPESEDEAGEAPGRTPPAWRRPVIWSAIVLVVAWCQPVIEEFTGRGEGNISRIVASISGGDASTIGWERALRLIVEVMARGPWFTRSAYDSAIPPTAPNAPVYAVVTMTTSLIVVALAAVALVGGGVWASRHGHRRLTVMTVMAGLTLVIGYVALATSPVNVVAIAVHQMRWLWPIAAFVSAVWLTTLISLVRSHEVAHRRVVIGGVVAAGIVAAFTLPTHTSRAPGPTDSIRDLDRATELVAQLDTLEDRGTILFDPSVLPFAEPYSGLVLAELQDRGIEFRFDDEVFIRQFGEGRRNDGTPTLRMWEVVGSIAATVPAGAERVAYVEAGDESVGLFVEPIR